MQHEDEDEDDEDGGADSELDDSDSEAELAAEEEEEEEDQEALKDNQVVPAALRESVYAPSTAPSGTRGGRRRSQDKPSEEVRR